MLRITELKMPLDHTEETLKIAIAEMGFRPIILERGKSVRERTKDTFRLCRKQELNPESNVQFGEGGAGTFSDGKLYTQIKDIKHYGRKVLTEHVEAGAPPEILYAGKPHIGTFRLVSMVEHLRGKIESLGGGIRFQSRVENLIIENRKVKCITAKTDVPSTVSACVPAERWSPPPPKRDIS